MNKDHLTKFEKVFINSKSNRVFFIIAIFSAVSLVHILVLRTGGLKYSYSHTMYIPIVVAGLALGKTFGVIVGIYAGILLGPLQPLDTTTMEMQVFINWFFRLVVFTIIGFLSGLFATVLRKHLHKISTLYSSNPETMIPNSFALSQLENDADVSTKYLLTSIIINNNIIIIEMLGNDLYNEIVKRIYDRLVEGVKNPVALIQGGSNRLWIAKKYDEVDHAIYEIQTILKNQISIKGIPLYIDYSIGVTVVKGIKNVKNIALYRQADIAARIAYNTGKSYEVFKPEHLIKRYDYELLGSLESALAENQTFLVYQPIYNLATNKPEGFEALIRWQHPNKGLITPNKFIPPVEETKLIHLLTEWVLHNVCQKIIEFSKQNIKTQISINISVKNLSNPKFFDTVMNIIDKHKINPQQINLEITESMIMSNPNENIALLNEFLVNGFTTSIDDFGVGFSSLQYLARLPIKVVKIDRFFIEKMATEEHIKSIVESTVNMSHNLGYTVVAEGIENDTILDIAKNLKCDYGQGYHFSKPMNSDLIIKWYKENS